MPDDASMSAAGFVLRSHLGVRVEKTRPTCIAVRSNWPGTIFPPEWAYDCSRTEKYGAIRLGENRTGGC